MGKMAKHPITGRRMRNKSTGRNYRKEYDNYQGNKKQIKNRTSRNAARRKLMNEGSVKKGDDKDVAHKNDNPKQNSRSNLKPQSKFKNRSFERTSKGKTK
jgi:hypothetical protein